MRFALMTDGTSLGYWGKRGSGDCRGLLCFGATKAIRGARSIPRASSTPHSANTMFQITCM